MQKYELRAERNEWKERILNFVPEKLRNLSCWYYVPSKSGGGSKTLAINYLPLSAGNETEKKLAEMFYQAMYKK